MNPRATLLLLGLALDFAVLTAVTILGALHVLPHETIAALIGALIGAGARGLHGRHLPPGAGGGGAASGSHASAETPTGMPFAARLAEASSVALIATLLFPFLLHADQGAAFPTPRER